jgi:hypothetical protein
MASLHSGAKVTVLPAGPPPHVAELVQVTPKFHTVRGKLVSFSGQALVVQTGGKNPGPVTIVLQGPTRFELVKGKDRVFLSSAILYSGAEVTVHAVGYGTLVAERVEVPPRKQGKITPPKEKGKIK